MNGVPFHRRLLHDVLTAGAGYPLAVAGEYAVRAHGLADRRGHGIDVATETPEPMEEIASTVRTRLIERGWRVRKGPVDPLSARLHVADPGDGAECDVDIGKETLWRPPVETDLGLTVSLEDLVGTRVRALADRGLPRDLVDVWAAGDHWSTHELEELGRRHTRDVFDLPDLQARLTGTELIDDRALIAQGLDSGETGNLRRWAQAWADDIAERLAEAEDDYQ